MVDFTDNDDDFAPAEVVRPNRPVGVTIVTVLAIIIGALYLMNALTGIPALIIQVVAPDTFNFQAESDDPGLQFQYEVQERTGEINRRYLMPLLLTSFLSFALGVGLIYFAIQILRKDRPRDLRFLQSMALMAIFYVVVVTALYGWVQWQTWTAFMGAIQTRQPDGGDSQIFERFMTLSLVGGMVIAGIYQLMQLAYFIIAHLVLKKYAATLGTEPSTPA